MAGVTILAMAGDKVGWLHFFMEPIEQGGSAIDAAIRQQAQGR